MARVKYGDDQETSRRADLTWKPTVDDQGAPRMTPDRSKDFIEGHLVLVKEDVGKNDSMVYQVQIFPDPKVPYTGFGEPGNYVDIWGCTVLDERMSKFLADPKFGKGAWCRIEYDGRQIKKDAKNKAEHLITSSDRTIVYSVIGDDEIPAIKIEGSATTYKAVASNAAPVNAEAKATTPVAAPPASIDSDDPDADDLPF